MNNPLQASHPVLYLHESDLKFGEPGNSSGFVLALDFLGDGLIRARMGDEILNVSTAHRLEDLPREEGGRTVTLYDVNGTPAWSLWCDAVAYRRFMLRYDDDTPTVAEQIEGQQSLEDAPA